MTLGTTHRAGMIESVLASRPEDGNLIKCIDIFLTKSLAEKIGFPFNSILSNPLNALIGLLVGYILQTILLFPFLLSSYIVTIYGAWLLFFVGIYYLGNFIAMAIAFPGCTLSYHREVSADYIKRLFSQLDAILSMTANFTATIMLIQTNQISKPNNSSIISSFQDLKSNLDFIPFLLQCVNESVNELTNNPKQKLNIIDKEEITKFQLLLQQFNQIMNDFIKEMTINYSQNKQNNTISTSTSTSSNNTTNSNLLTISAKTLQSTENLKNFLHIFQTNTKKEENSIQQMIKMLSSIFQKPKGIELLSLLIMKKYLIFKYNAINYQLIGNNNNFIDCIICQPINSNSTDNLNSNSNSNSTSSSNSSLNSNSNLSINFSSKSYQNYENSTNNNNNNSNPNNFKPSSKGCVVFCSPNAMFYESLILSHPTCSWLAFYLSQGFDVCFHNYRGYGASTGTVTALH